SGLRAGEWAAGRSGSQPVSAHGPGARIFIFVRGAAGHADGSIRGDDGGRSGQSTCREGTCRSDLSARRRKEGAEGSQSPSSRTAHTEHTASGRCSGAGRAADRKVAPGDENVYGVAHGGERRTWGVGSFAGRGSGSADKRRPDGGHQLHVD